MMGTLYDDGRFRTLNVIDESNREGLAIEIGTTLPSLRVIALGGRAGWGSANLPLAGCMYARKLGVPRSNTTDPETCVHPAIGAQRRKRAKLGNRLQAVCHALTRESPTRAQSHRRAARQLAGHAQQRWRLSKAAGGDEHISRIRKRLRAQHRVRPSETRYSNAQ